MQLLLLYTYIVCYIITISTPENCENNNARNTRESTFSYKYYIEGCKELPNAQTLSKFRIFFIF